MLSVGLEDDADKAIEPFDHPPRKWSSALAVAIVTAIVCLNVVALKFWSVHPNEAKSLIDIIP